MVHLDNETLRKYRSMLPHGYINILAKRSKVSRLSVSNFLAGRYNSKKIEDTVLDVIAELVKERNKKLKAAGLL